MKNTQRSQALGFAVATLAILLATTAPASAVYLGALPQGKVAQITFTNQSLDKLAVTILLINHRDDITHAVPYTIPAADSTPGSGVMTIPVFVSSRITRVILLVDPPGGGAASLRIDGGAPVNIDGEVRLTFDTEPPPR